MTRILDGYIFSKDERQIIPTSIFFLLSLLTVLGIVTCIFSVMPFWIFKIYTVVILLVLIYLTINHMRYRHYRTARYCITNTSISLIYGDVTVKIGTNDDYYISILQLYKSSGKSYSYRPYIVIWQGDFTIEKVHPFDMIRKNYIVLPLSDSVINQVQCFINHSDVPNYPKVLHHNEVNNVNEILTF